MISRGASVAGLTAAAVAGAMWLSAWRSHAQHPVDEPSNTVRRLDAAAKAPRIDRSDRGATYYWLEERAVRTTTRFGDATAIAERVAGGDLQTRLTDRFGNEIARLAVDRVETTGDVIDFSTPDGNRLRAAGRATARPTLDWANRQAYALWKDRGAEPDAALEWQGDIMRVRGGRPLDGDAEAAEIRTEWSDGFAAAALRSTGARRHAVTGTPMRGTQLESVLTRDGLEVGRSRWSHEEQVYMWSVPGLTKGYFDAERLKEYGGWPFTPDLAWTNVQTYAFHYFHSLVATQGFVAGRRTGDAQGWWAMVVEAVAPTLHANEPGCDWLHWLDGTTIRPCCDMHDRCYEKYGCTWKSWWQWWSSWRCDLCNVGAAFCASSQWPPYSQSFP